MTQTSSEISEMFSEISRRYDRANRMISLGLDRGWRSQLIHAANPIANERVLDLATGTADLIADFTQTQIPLELVGLDLSRGMLEVGLEKVFKNGAIRHSLLIEGDALNLPFEDESFEIVTIAFGLRNLTDREIGLNEMARVLNPGGRLLVLEFSLPKLILWRQLYLFYLKHLLPRIGGLLTGSRDAYQYLHDSIRAFPEPDKIEAMMNLAGLVPAERKQLLGGVAVLYKGVKS